MAFQPYDFRVLENGIELFVEVKGTSSMTKEVIYLSQAEWQVLFEKAKAILFSRSLGSAPTITDLKGPTTSKTLMRRKPIEVPNGNCYPLNSTPAQGRPSFVLPRRHENIVSPAEQHAHTKIPRAFNRCDSNNKSLAPSP